MVLETEARGPQRIVLECVVRSVGRVSGEGAFHAEALVEKA